MAQSKFSSAIQSVSEIDLTVTGRNSGRVHTYPIWFAVDGETLYLIPVKGSDTEWYKNVLKNPAIRLTSKGQTFTTNARILTNQAHLNQILEKFRDKYGRNVKSYYPKYDVALEVSLA